MHYVIGVYTRIIEVFIVLYQFGEHYRGVVRAAILLRRRQSGAVHEIGIVHSQLFCLGIHHTDKAFHRAGLSFRKRHACVVSGSHYRGLDQLLSFVFAVRIEKRLTSAHG